LSLREFNAVGRGALEGPVAAVFDCRARRVDEGLGRVDGLDHGRRRIGRGQGVAVNLLGREDRRGAGEKAGFEFVTRSVLGRSAGPL
jgi:hypothetical protein